MSVILTLFWIFCKSTEALSRTLMIFFFFLKFNNYLQSNFSNNIYRYINILCTESRSVNKDRRWWVLLCYSLMVRLRCGFEGFIVVTQSISSLSILSELMMPWSHFLSTKRPNADLAEKYS